MRFFFPTHFNGGNRGCEAIAKGTAVLLSESKDNLICLCSDVEFDQKLGIDKYVTLIKQIDDITLDKKIFRRLYNLFINDTWLRKKLNYRFIYKKFLSNMNSDDILLSTGGDLMCYDDNQVIYTTDYAHSKGFTTILWGCSMSLENLSEKKLETLKKFDLIYVRESLTEAFLKSLGMKHVCLFPDPAFILHPEVINCHEYISNTGTIGINISEFIIGGIKLDSPFGKKVKELLDYIINKTAYNILLIPHVTWIFQDDVLVAQNIKSLYNDCSRINVVDTRNYNYCQLRYIISQCKFFIGSRTHAVISAYSTCVPTIALGYSIKSKGIAKDIGLPDCLVVDSKCKSKDNDLLNSFKYLMSNEHNIRTHLNEFMPIYKSKLTSLKYYIQDFLKEKKHEQY